MTSALAVLFPFLFGLLLGVSPVLWLFRKLSQPKAAVAFLGGLLRGLELGGTSGLWVRGQFVRPSEVASAVERSLLDDSPGWPPGPPSDAGAT